MKGKIPENFMKKLIIVLFFFTAIVAGLVFACRKTKVSEDNDKKEPIEADNSVQAPAFNTDSAYVFIQKQLEFGPRVPNTSAHVNCGDYLIKTLKSYGADVVEQKFEAQAFDGKKLQLRNIIASFNREAPKRILLAAHWDSRPFADKDTINKDKPILGANDGASGVAVLLQLASMVASANPKLSIGVDIIFFDGEDYGKREDDVEGENDVLWWCLGSQYWSKNKHKENYTAYYGILLDMVGGKNDKFTQEGNSLIYAPKVVEKVWGAAQKLGFSSYFLPKQTDAITDDHFFVNEFAKIPMIDIVAYDADKNRPFGDYHHTHRDSLDIIDKNTLKAVGQTLAFVIWNEGYSPPV